jgi:hypothetical protein
MDSLPIERNARNGGVQLATGPGYKRALMTNQWFSIWTSFVRLIPPPGLSPLAIAQKRSIFVSYEDWTFGGSSGLSPGDHRIFRWLAWWRWVARWRWMAWWRVSRWVLRTRILRRSPLLECWLLSMERRLALVGWRFQPVVAASASSSRSLPVLRLLRSRLRVRILNSAAIGPGDPR